MANSSWFSEQWTFNHYPSEFDRPVDQAPMVSMYCFVLNPVSSVRALQHPALVQCLAQCSEVTPYLLVMEFCPLVRHKSSCTRLQSQLNKKLRLLCGEVTTVSPASSSGRPEELPAQLSSGRLGLSRPFDPPANGVRRGRRARAPPQIQLYTQVTAFLSVAIRLHSPASMLFDEGGINTRAMLPTPPCGLLLQQHPGAA